MQHRQRYGTPNRPVVAFLSIFLLASTTTAAGEADGDGKRDASEYVREAEIALRNRDYRQAAEAYREAAARSESVEIARKATQVAFNFRFDDAALGAARRWVKLDKESEEARAYLGQIYFRLDDLRDARKQFSRLIKADPEDPGRRVLSLVDLLRDERQPERADRLVRTLAKPYPESWHANYAVAILALQSGDSEHAKTRAEKALELEPENSRPHMIIARALMFDGEEQQAIEYLAHVIGDSPRPDPDARMELALMYMLTGRDDDALSQVNQVLLENGNRVDALRLMAIINFRLERLDAAWDDFEDLLATGQHRMDALYYLGRIADYREQYERAVRLYREVRQGSNAVLSQRCASALLAHQLEREDDAYKLLDDFAAASPSHAVDMLVSKAQLLVSLDRYEEGLVLYDKAIDYRPDSEEMLLGRAALLLEMGRIDDAIAEHRKALKRWPDSALTQNALGYTLADRTDQFDEAERLIRRAYEQQPNNAAIIDSMGWILYKRGKLEEGLEYLQSAYERLKDAEVAAHIVEVLAELDRHDEALELLESATERDPDSDLLQNVRKRYFPDSIDAEPND